ncbi:hypothetical protein H0W91_00985 [Patescibacteria group bacterium]|nr:hypothetical protein [Patescibacteria group bacterium]
MVFNPKTDQWMKRVQAEEIERIRKEIRKLPRNISSLIEKGEDTIDEHFKFRDKEKETGRYTSEDVIGLNVFHLGENIPGDVLKYLMMLYTASGFYHVGFMCDQFSTENSATRVKYPNSITLRISR